MPDQIALPLAGGDAAGAAPAPAPQGLPSEEQMLASLGEKEAGAADQPGKDTKPVAEKPAPQDDPDGDAAFEKEASAYRLPEGLKKRIQSLTEQRNKAREEAKAKAEGLEKDYGFFKPYANDQGRQYLNTLVQFDSLLEQAFENNPWLADLVKQVVVEGKGTVAQKEKVLELLGEARQEAADEQGAGQAQQTPKELKELLDWKARVEAQQQQAAEVQRRRAAVEHEKETYRAEIAEFHAKNPQFKSDKAFTRLALQVSAARNISFTEAAKEMAEYVGSREKANLSALAKADQERSGAGVEAPGRGGVPAKSRPPIGSDEEAAEMEAYFASR